MSRNRPFWYGLDHQPIGAAEAERLLRDGAARRVAATALDDEVHVSTVFLVLDHRYGDGPPMLYETMVFGGPHDMECWRWPTREAALAGHDRVVAWLHAPAEADGP